MSDGSPLADGTISAADVGGLDASLDTKLPLAGGTMTGAITFAGTQTWPTFNQNTTGSAATLATGRTIGMTGDVTYTSGSFNGSANVTGTATLANSGVTAGTYTKITVDAKGRATSGTTLSASDIPNLDASKITSGVLDAARLPSYVDDVLEYTNLAAFPVTGETGKIYVALDTNKTYRWGGSSYVYITSGAVDSVAGKTGVVTLTSSDVGLGLVENKSSATIRSELTSANVTTALGFTPYNSTNPSGYITSSALSSYLPLSGGTLTGNITVSSTSVGAQFGNLSVGYGGYYNTLQTKDGTSDLHLNYSSTGNINLGVGGGYTTINQSTRSPVFYDSNNTAYYIDPNSSSVLNGNVVINQTGVTYTSGDNTPIVGGALTTNRLHINGSIQLTNNDDAIVIGRGTATFLKDEELGFGWGGGWYMTDADWIRTRNSKNIYSGGGIIRSDSSVRGPIFYDQDNTSYYTDPTSTSVLLGLTLAGSLTLNGSTGSTPYLNLSNGPTLSTISSGEIILRNLSALRFSDVNDWDYNSWAGLKFVNSTKTIHIGVAGSQFTANNTQTGYVNMPNCNLTVERDIRTPIVYDSNDTGYYTDQASTSNLNLLRVNQHLEQGNNLGRPNVSWSASGTSTGMVIFYLPGTTSNYGMVHMVFDIYEYNSPRVATIVIGGHNWSSSWYNTGCNVIGYTDKQIRLGIKDGRFCVIFGTSDSSWSYGTIVLRKIHNGGFYDNIMDMLGNWGTTQTTTESFTNISGDLKALRTPSTFISDSTIYAYGDIRSPIYYDYNDTSYFADPSGRSRLSTLDFGNGSYYIHMGDWGMRNTTPYGWIQFGPANTSHAHIYTDRSNFYFNAQIQVNGGSNINTSDIRANAFYDNNDTGYYIDPNSTSNSALRMRGGALFGPNPTWGAYLYVGTNGNVDVGTATVAATNGNLHLDAANGYVMYLNNYATSSYTIASQSIRSPIFYDSNDTNYYTDPSGSSQLVGLTVRNLYFRGVGGDSGADQASYGIYQEPGGWNHPYPDLVIGYHTGVKIGGYYGYGGTRFYNNNPASGSLIASIGDGDNALRSYDNVIAYASDRRLKENIVTIPNALNKVLALNGVTFDWKPEVKDLGFEPSSKHEAGVLAQEVQAVLPEAVEIAPFDYDWKKPNKSKSGEEYLTVKYEKLVPLLIEAIKEQQQQIEALKKQVESLL